MKLKMLTPWKKSYDKPRQRIKKQRHHFVHKVRLVKAMVFPIVMYRYASWPIKKTEPWRINAFEIWCWRRLFSLLDSKDIKPVNPKRNQLWIFIGRTDAEAEAPILWPERADTLEKTQMPGKDWGEVEKGVTEDEMFGWYHWLDGHEFEQTPGDSKGQESLAWWSTWCCKQSDMTEWLTTTNISISESAQYKTVKTKNKNKTSGSFEFSFNLSFHFPIFLSTQLRNPKSPLLVS